MNPRVMGHWGIEAKRFWRHINAEYSITPEYLEILRAATDRLNAYWTASTILEKEGLTYMVGETLRRRPEIEAAKAAYSGFLNACKLLRIDAKDHSKRQGRPGCGV